MTFARLAVVILAALTLCWPSDAQASGPLPSADARCRSNLYAGVSKLARGTVSRLGKCHSQRLRGQLPPATDCNDPANAVGPTHLERYADSIRDRAASRCEGVASPAAALGWVSCPAPCDSIVLSSYADVAECMICFTRSTIGSLAGEVFGTPAAPSATGERRCQDRIARAQQTYLAKRLGVQRKCQQDQDNGELNPMIDCETADPDNRVALALGRLQRALARCDDAQLSALDSCGATVPAVQACVPAASDAAAGDLFDLGYYPEQVLATPTPTQSGTPTRTPTLTRTPTITPTIDPNALNMVLLPGGGTARSCRGTCVGGVNTGVSCAADSDCPGSTCSPARQCQGGVNDGNGCNTDASCPGGICVPARVCAGGGYDGLACATGTACNGCDPNRICTAAGTPLPCCAGVAQGTCPLRGSCAIVQGTLPVRGSMNGVCSPRVPPDVFCTSDAECGPGQSCDFGRLIFALGSPDLGTGEAEFSAQPGDFRFPPMLVAGLGTICLSAADAAEGFADCDGGAAGIDQLVSIDHNTTPGDPGNGGGFPDDPECDDTATGPGGVSTFAEMNGGICISPKQQTLSGTFDSGDLAFDVPLLFDLMEAGEVGPDGLYCTGDEPPTDAEPAFFRLATGVSAGKVFDRNNNAGVVLGPGETCGVFPCVAEVVGSPVSCANLGSQNLGGLALGGANTQLDTPVGDIVTTIRLEARP